MKSKKGWRNEPLRHSLASKGVKTGRGVHGRADRLSKHPVLKWKKSGHNEWRKNNRFIRWVYDDESNYWKVQKGYFDNDSSLIVEDVIITDNKKQAIKKAKELSK